MKNQLNRNKKNTTANNQTRKITKKIEFIQQFFFIVTLIWVALSFLPRHDGYCSGLLSNHEAIEPY